MSTGYRAVQWVPAKRAYDLVLVGAIASYLLLFVGVGKWVYRGDRAISDPILVLRACGTCAYLMLHVVLCIGPLARLDRRFLPLLYNRRHFGVATFLVGSMHALLTLGWYHGFGEVTPLESLLTSNTQYRSVAAFPFEILGLVALAILFLMAATSHDFWLKNLSPRAWKQLHMLVYVAWALLVLHVALGTLQAERSPVYVGLVAAGVAAVSALHLAAGRREVRHDRRLADAPAADGWIEVAGIDDIPNQRGIAICLPQRERVAIFRHEGKISALSNVCAHQGGPLGEGRIVDGCVTCPWHGYGYRPHDGQAPPPFTERVATYRVKLRGRRILVDPRPLPPGTPVEPASIVEG